MLDFGSDRWAVEVKLTASPTAHDMDRLDRTADLIGASRRFLISKTPESTWGERRVSCNLEEFLGHVGRMTS